MRPKLHIILVALTFFVTATAARAQDPYETAHRWYSDHAEAVLEKFEQLRPNAKIHPQKYTLVPHHRSVRGGHELLISTWDESFMAVFTPNDNDEVEGKVSKLDKLPDDCFWEGIDMLSSYITTNLDITAIQRPLPVREVNKKSNKFIVVVEKDNPVKTINDYTQMVFKPHINRVRLADSKHVQHKDSEGYVISDDMRYIFSLADPTVLPKMFRGYDNTEMVPWVVKDDFTAGHTLLQFNRWKEGEPEKKAGKDALDIISHFYGGRAVKASKWIADLESAERSFYAVQFENKGSDALAAMVCIAEGEVVSSWEFHGQVDPNSPDGYQSVWFVDDEGDFLAHAPEIQVMTATEQGLVLFVRLFGGESVQYLILRETGETWQCIQRDVFQYFF